MDCKLPRLCPTSMLLLVAVALTTQGTEAKAQTVPDIAPVPTNLPKYDLGVTPNVPGVSGRLVNGELQDVIINSPGEYTFAYPVRGTTFHAVSVKSDNVIIRGAEVVGANHDGIKAANQTNVHFVDCNVRDCNFQGFAFHGMTDSSISGCTSTNNGYNPNGGDKFYHGFYFSGDRVRFENNTAKDNADNGIQAYPYVRDCVIRNNVSEGHDGPGHNRPDRTGYVINTAGNNFILTNVAHEPYESDTSTRWKFRWSGPPEDSDTIIGNYWQRLKPSSSSDTEETVTEVETTPTEGKKKKRTRKASKGIRARGGSSRR